MRGSEAAAWVKQASLTHPVGNAPVTLHRPASLAENAAIAIRDWWRGNGYLYEIDEQNRTRRISGEITLNPEQGRSPTAQRAAGGGDRRETDHGGHYIARRFNGPTEAFNHFAQDASFNRRDYAKLENQWERAKRQGKQVRVKIVPVYEGKSQRPSALNVWFYIDGKEGSHQLPNEPKGRRDVKHRH
ncbi:DNA/RNA non-specific endonuclease [Sphingomonas sp.]|uniref:DNA/RNA non-specific endonuclease n=1 Tax=Sphingomonas sp. TaxID=28214 RepID=UPI00307EE505